MRWMQFVPILNQWGGLGYIRKNQHYYGLSFGTLHIHCQGSCIIAVNDNLFQWVNYHCTKKPTIHQVITMLATSKNVLLSGYNHLLTTGADDHSL